MEGAKDGPGRSLKQTATFSCDHRLDEMDIEKEKNLDLKVRNNSYWSNRSFGDFI